MSDDSIEAVLTKRFVDDYHNYVSDPAEMRRRAQEWYDEVERPFGFETFFAELEKKARATHPNQTWIKQEFG